MIGSHGHGRWVVPAFLAAVAALSATVWFYGYVQALGQLSRRAEADLELAGDRLGAQLQIFRELAVLMADHPALSVLDTPQQRDAARALLQEVADKTGALDMIFADTSGRVLAAAGGGEGRDLSAERYFTRAMQGALGSGHGIQQPPQRRVFTYAAPAFAADGTVRGAVIVMVDVEDVEQTWRGTTPAVFFTDEVGEVFVSNRSELLFWRRSGDAPGIAPRTGPAGAFASRRIGPYEIWRTAWGPYIPARALHLAADLPVIGMTVEVLVDAAPARRLALLQAAAVAGICLAFGAMLYLATERRRTLALANAVLESRVGARTAELSRANTALRREIDERHEAEAALKQAQVDLVQAGKLSALGQMSAGISHELNQPLMAIQSFADNGALYLQRGRVSEAGENLGRIAELTRRMGRIIKNLRAFARQESAAAARVDIVATIATAIELTQTRLDRDGVTLDWVPPRAPVWVRGGEVRLGQVFVNLINNASDAMAGQDGKCVAITLRVSGDRVRVEVADNGPGIDDPERIFDPFYSTKPVGASEGMGLGLSISYGLVQSFGGAIRGRNRDAGGAVFTVELAPWVQEAAA
jgi:two-component system, NtrC family, C4-dicarboxylate transport sensor histidine kinase DctB